MRPTHIAVFAIALSMAAASGMAQDDVARRWALSVGISPVMPVVTGNDAPSTQYDPVKTGGEPGFSAHLEYFIPHSGFSVVGGYDHEGLYYFSGDVSATMSQIMLGGRWYFLSPDKPLQPYLGAASFWNMSGRHAACTMSMSSSHTVYERDYRVSSPLLSVAPSVGVDMYFFSCIALEVDYGFRLAVDGKTKVNTRYNGSDRLYATRSPMHRHAISVALKTTFPFAFTRDDFGGLIDSLLGVEHRRTVKKTRINLDNY